MIKNNDKNCYFYGLGHCMVDFFVPNVDDLIFSKLKANSPLHLDKEEFSDFFSNFDIKININFIAKSIKFFHFSVYIHNYACLPHENPLGSVPRHS